MGVWGSENVFGPSVRGELIIDARRPELKALFEHYWNYFADARKKRAELAANLDHVNKILSGLRAEAVRKYFIAKGIKADRLTSKGYGMDQPIMPNDTPAHRELNRRVQFMRTEAGTTP